MKQVIKRSDSIYVNLDRMESQVEQYYSLRRYFYARKMVDTFGYRFDEYREKDINSEMDIEYKINPKAKEHIVEFVGEHCKNKDMVEKLKEHIKNDIFGSMDLFSIMATFHGDDDIQEKLFKQFSGNSQIFLTDFDYYRDPNRQVWINIDLSLSKEELLAQIESIKDNYDSNPKDIFSFGGIEKTPIASDEWIDKGLNPFEFSKDIKRQFGDMLFVYDCTYSGYKRQYIINESFNHRSINNDNPTALTHDTIRKYLKKATELMDTIII